MKVGLEQTEKATPLGEVGEKKTVNSRPLYLETLKENV
jgi:hypothetical protein